MIPTLVLAAVLLTSALSGVIGMAGGMLLMALLAALFPVPVAMLLHGVTQGAANGSRAWFLRAHVRWAVLPPYLAGAVLALGVFAFLTFVPERGLLLLLLGALPWLGRLLPAAGRLDVEGPATAFACGAVVTAAQLLAGASGPLLDLFFLHARLDRRAVVATKAVTQALGHGAKLVYYGAVLGLPAAAFEGAAARPWLFVAVVPAALLGTRIGTRLLDRLEDATFRRASGRIVLALGAACSLGGLVSLLGP